MTKFVLSFTEDSEYIAGLLEKLLSEKSNASVFKLLIDEKFKYTHETLNPHDVWIIVFPKQYSKINQLFNYDLINKLHRREISTVCIGYSNLSFPKQFRNSKSFIISSNNRDFEKLLNKLKQVSSYIINLSNIKFNRLNYSDFEYLVALLLEKLKFNLNIKMSRDFLDKGYDLSATTKYEDPFKKNHKVNWSISVKFYKKSRADIEMLNEFIKHLSKLPPNYKGLLVTNSQLTSSANEWLKNIEIDKRVDFTVIDGIQLRELVAKHNDIVEKFFGKYV